MASHVSSFCWRHVYLPLPFSSLRFPSLPSWAKNQNSDGVYRLYQFVGSYTASGTNQTEGNPDGGNLENVKLAHSLDMGVFCISPNDKGGMMYKPSKVCFVLFCRFRSSPCRELLSIIYTFRCMRQIPRQCRCCSFNTTGVLWDQPCGGACRGFDLSCCCYCRRLACPLTPLPTAPSGRG